MNEDVPKLLRAIAGGSQAKENRHDVIFNAAADEIYRLEDENRRLRSAYCKMCIVLHEFVGGFDTLETAAEKLRAKFNRQPADDPMPLDGHWTT